MKNIKNRQLARKEKLAKANDKKSIEKIPIPKDVKKWEKIAMHLSGENGQGVVVIKIFGNDDFEYKTDLSKLGFGNLKSDSKPRKSWVSFLYVLAMNKGVYPMRDYLPKSQKNEKDRINQWKKEVKENFIYAFGINADPISWDSKEKVYVAKLKIIPPQHDRIDIEELGETEKEFQRRQEIPAKKK